MESEVSEVKDRTSGPAAKAKLSATMTATSPRPEKQRLRSRKLRTEPQGVWIFRGLGKEGKTRVGKKPRGESRPGSRGECSEEGGVGGTQSSAGGSEGAPCTEHSGRSNGP